MSADKNPFEILGITPGADLVVINAAYKALARRYHPDMNPGVPPAELNKRMVEINWAKEALERNHEAWRQHADRDRRAAQRTPHREGRARGAPAGTRGVSTEGVVGAQTRGEHDLIGRLGRACATLLELLFKPCDLVMGSLEKASAAVTAYEDEHWCERRPLWAPAGLALVKTVIWALELSTVLALAMPAVAVMIMMVAVVSTVGLAGAVVYLPVLASLSAWRFMGRVARSNKRGRGTAG